MKTLNLQNIWQGLCVILSIIGLSLVASCSQEVPQVEKKGDYNSDYPGGLDASSVPILLSINNFQFDVITRGLNAFESIDSYGSDKETAKEKWGNAPFYVLSYLVNNSVYSGGHDFSKLYADYVPSSDSKEVQYCLMDGQTGNQDPGVPFHLDYGVSSDIPSFTTIDASTNYYYNGEHQNYKYDFFMYFADDAPLTDFVRSKDQVSCRVQIDGTQDVMQAKAKVTSEQVSGIIVPNNEFFGNDYAQYTYSAQAGRRGLIPKFVASHLMTQLRFQLLGADKTAGEVTVSDIIVKDVNTKGTFVVAAVEEDSLGVRFDSNPMDLHLPERDPLTFKMTDTSSNHLIGRIVNDGEVFSYPYGLLLPSAKEYEIQMVCQQLNEDTGEIRTFYPTYKIGLSGDKLFDPGSIYTVKISVYGYQKVLVTLDLPGWNDSGVVIDIGNDQDAFPGYTTGD